MNPRYARLSDQWELIAPYMRDSTGRAGRPSKEHRLVVEGIIYRCRAGIPWHDLPAHFGSRKTVWKCHRRYVGDGTRDMVLAVLLGHTQGPDLID